MSSYVITGAGTGIGAATAVKLAENGHELVLIGRRKEPLESVLESLPGKDHVIVQVDVSDKKALHGVLNSGVMEGRSVAGLFANAGIGGENRYGDEDRWEQIIDINLSGAYYSIMECLPFLIASSEKYSHVVVTSSCLARFGVPYYSAYCASKSGITGLVKALAMELAPSKVLVNAVLPGWVDTEMARKGMELLAGHTHTSYDQILKEQMEDVPLQKMSEPEEIADLVAYLFSNSQTSITGQCLDINNGSFMI